MFRAKTLLVIGAGASAEVGMPVGAKLLTEIVKLTDIAYDVGRMVRGDHHIAEALKLILNEGRSVELYNQHLHAAWQLAASAKQALSIDNVIDALEDERIERVGKLGIVRAIHKAEQASNFFKSPDGYPDTLDVGKFANTWYDSLTKLLCEGVKKSAVASIFENLEIINFNYDRCLEQYLPFSLGNYYGIKPSEIRELMPTLTMLRPYGVAGKLPWQTAELPAVQFGGGHSSQTAQAASQIRTFTERVQEGEELSRIRDATANAERIVFLGFAFHRQNVDLIAAKALGNIEIVATAHDVSKSDQSVIEDELLTAFEIDNVLAGQQIKMSESTCNVFFRDYWRTLTADARPPDYEYTLSNL